MLTQRVKGDPVCYWNSRTTKRVTGHWIPLFKEIENNLEPGKEKNIDRKRFYYNLETKTSWHLRRKIEVRETSTVTLLQIWGCNLRLHMRIDINRFAFPFGMEEHLVLRHPFFRTPFLLLLSMIQY